MPSILFVCKANQFRSPLAAACFQRILLEKGCQDEWQVNSAGTWAVSGLHVAPEAIRAASTVGIDISAHVTRGIVPSFLENFDLILVMESGQREALLIEFPYLRDRVYLLSEVVEAISYDIPDLRSPQQSPEEIARDLSDLIQRGFPKICQLAASLSGFQS